MAKKDTSRIFASAHALGTASAAIQTAQERITELETQNKALRAAQVAPAAPPPPPPLVVAPPVPPPAPRPTSIPQALAEAVAKYQRAVEAQRARQAGGK